MRAAALLVPIRFLSIGFAQLFVGCALLSRLLSLLLLLLLHGMYGWCLLLLFCSVAIVQLLAHTWALCPDDFQA